MGDIKFVVKLLVKNYTFFSTGNGGHFSMFKIRGNEKDSHKKYNKIHK